jgi:hypothetical protein
MISDGDNAGKRSGASNVWNRGSAYQPGKPQGDVSMRTPSEWQKV